MLNQCNFIGRTGQEISLRYTPAGEAVATVSLACSESWKGKDGQKQEKTEWVNLVIWKKLAEIMSQYVKKGDLIYVSGKMQTRKWQNKDGVDQYTTEIIVNDMKMFGGKKDGERTEHRPAATYEEPPFDADQEIPF